MNIDDIQAFLAVVANRSLTKAAESLHLSQSSVSHRLKNLERELGLLLIERGKGLKKIALTPSGDEFVHVAEKWRQLLLETKALGESGKNALAIGAVDSVNTYLLPELYQKIISEKPELRLHIYTQNSAEIYRLIETRTIDIGFVLHERVVQNIEAEPFFAEPMVVIRLASEGQKLAPQIHPQDLRAEDELYHEWFPAYQIWHNKWWDQFTASHIQVSNGPMVLPLLRTPQQWAIVPLSLALSKAATKEYVLQRLSEPSPDRICYKLTHKFAKGGTLEALRLVDDFILELPSRFSFLKNL